MKSLFLFESWYASFIFRGHTTLLLYYPKNGLTHHYCNSGLEATAKQPRESLYIPDLAAAANRIIQALVTLCTWQKYEDSWNKISCDDWTKKYTLLLVSMYYCTYYYRGSLDSGNSSSLPFCYQNFFPFYSEISARNTKDYRFLWYIAWINFVTNFPAIRGPPVHTLHVFQPFLQGMWKVEMPKILPLIQLIISSIIKRCCRLIRFPLKDFSATRRPTFMFCLALITR